MQWFLWDEFDKWISERTIRRWFKIQKYSKRKIRFNASERDQFLHDDWIRRLSQWHHYQLVFVDESAANERTKDHKYGWAPIGVWPQEQRPQKRSELWSILPAYTSREGYIAYEIIQGSCTKALFLHFLKTKVLPLCNYYDPLNPQPNSVLIMDNASIHRGPEIRALCNQYGVLLEYLPPYSPDYNPIKESFAEIKGWMKKNRDLAQAFADDFAGFINLAVTSLVGRKAKHFTSCYISLED